MSVLRHCAIQLGRALGMLPTRPEPDSLGLLIGYAAIARFLGVTRGQARALVRRGAIPAFELDGAPCGRRSSLQEHIARLEADRASHNGAQP